MNNYDRIKSDYFLFLGGSSMYDILLKSSAFIFVIFLGYFLKKRGFYSPNDSKFVSKTVINLILPSAIISSFGRFQKDNSLFILIFLGLFCNALLVFLGYAFSKGKGNKIRALYMLNFSGYNIGNFTLPFVQNFLDPFAVIAICMFDIGNSISCTGGSYAVTTMVTSSTHEKKSFKFLFERLFKSVPFMTYMLMLLLAILNIQIPRPIVSITSLIGTANGFMAMLMIGLMFEIEFKWSYISQAFFILGIRYSIALLLAVVFYNFLPFPQIIRQVLAIAIFAPISSLSPYFTEKCEGDYGLASFVSSLSIMISIVIMTFLVISI